MKLAIWALLLFGLSSCASNDQNRHPDWDSGAQKQESLEFETIQEQQQTIRNQFPGRTYY